jgi:hypothetical protein
MVLAAEIWHYWIGVVLAAAAILTVVGLAVAYLVTVERPRYPKRGQEVPVPGADSSGK